VVSRLPETPKLELQVVREKSGDGPGFLTLRRFELVVQSGNGAEPESLARSGSFGYDLVERRALDAAVMVAHFEESGVVHVFLRSAIRPPVALRTRPPRHSGHFWEVPAGLIEPGETPVAAAVREIEEELGFVVREEELQPLGPATFPCPAVVAETHHFFHVRVDPGKRGPGRGDGSPLEAGAGFLNLPLDHLLEACRRGELADAKTELALRRLADVLRV
jgi:ADP-ribose pyrophosphatase